MPLQRPTPADVRLRQPNWIDATKGVLIVLVVFGHAWRGIFNAGLLTEDLFRAVDDRIYAFHMYVFFILAGFFHLPSLARKPLSQFLENRFQRLLWPMILWTYIILVLWPIIAETGWTKTGRFALALCMLAAMSATGVLAGTVPMRFLSWLGTGSMAIYLSHTIFSAGLREALFAMGQEES